MSKKAKTTVVASAAGALLAFGPALNAAADPGEREDLDRQVAVELQEQLAAGGPGSPDGAMLADVEDVQVDVTPELISAAGEDPADIAAYILNAAPTTSPQSQDASNPVESQPQALKEFTVDQFAGIPAVGAVWINQDLNVNISGDNVTSATTLGSSYRTGVSVFAWNPIRTTVEIKRGGGCIATSMKGTFDAIVKGAPVSFAATLLASDEARNGNLVSVTYQEC